MIKQFIKNLFSGSEGKVSKVAKPKLGKRVDIALDAHGINIDLVDRKAIEVVATLQQAGFEAYIVGGAVRDLLLGLRPKDFDVATNATPEDVKGLFRRAFIIGRRFRIVHVVYGRGREHEVIEVSTFRAVLDASAASAVSGNEKTSKHALAGMTHAVDASGRVLRDNVWGPQDEDAARRDFTINAMYYDPTRQLVVDYHHGMRDAKAKIIRMIGDPAGRFREDPVRIIRAVRFSAKLAAAGFQIEPKTKAAMLPALPLLADVPQSRLFDEMLKLLQTGHAIATVAQLRGQGLSTGIYPLLDVIVERADSVFVKAALEDTDRRVGEGKPVAPSFLLACALWAEVRVGWEKRLKHQFPLPALQESIDQVFDQRIGDVSGRGKLAADMREIWLMQPRFDKRVGSTPFSLVDHPRFRAGFDFLRLRAEAGEVSDDLAMWWEDFSLETDEGREAMVQEVREQQRREQQKPRAPKPVLSAADGAATDLDPAAHLADGPAKKRRRRRKPAARPGDAGGPVNSPGTLD